MWVVLLALVFLIRESPIVLGCPSLDGLKVVGISLSLLLAFWRVLYTLLCTLMHLFASAL